MSYIFKIRTIKTLNIMITKIINYIIKITNTIKSRWLSKSPKFFRGIIKIGCSISAIAISINIALSTSGAIEPSWWINIYPYLVGIPAGMAATAKLTKDYGIDEQK